MKNERIKFRGIDGWNRPVFQSVDFPRSFFGCTNLLFDSDATETEVLKRVTPEDLLFFGNKFGCEPMGTPANGLIILTTEDVEILKLRAKLEKVARNQEEFRAESRENYAMPGDK